MSIPQCYRQMLLVSMICILFTYSFLVHAYAAETSDVLSLVRESDGGKMFHTGDNTIVVLRLAGTWQEMGRQYGNLLRKEIPPVWDVTVQPLIDKKVISEKEALELFGKRVHETSSHRIQQFQKGIADSLGWSTDKVSLLNQSGAMGIYQAKIHAFAGCSSLLAWGSATKDGEMVTARNMDWYEPFLKFPVVLTVFNPTDGSHKLANVNWPGWFWAQSAINDAGVYIDLHDGTGSGGSVVYLERSSLINSVLDMMAEVDNAEALGRRLRTHRADISFIWTVADASPIGFSAETSPAASLRRDAENDLLAVVNSFLDPDWGLHVRDTASNSLTRYRNLHERATEARGTIDIGKMMDIFDLNLFNPDGTFKESGGATKPTNQDVDLTVYQIATKPATREVWLKVPLKTKWRHVDLKKLFED